MWGRTNENKKGMSIFWKDLSEDFVKKHGLICKKRQDEKLVDRQTTLWADRAQIQDSRW